MFAKGDTTLLNQTALAIVGTRDMTQYGREVTETLTKSLASVFTIVSGMAAGVDALAHETALTNLGKTIAVMGTGFDRIYPSSNKRLFDRLIKEGLVVTEYPYGTMPQPFFFPMRNRIVSGLSEGILVCEAGEKSGSLITARLGMEQGKDVFCVPGSLFTKQNKGNHILIQDGAKLITGTEDILVEFPYLIETFKDALSPPLEPLKKSPKPVLSDDEKHLYDQLSETPKELDFLIEVTGYSIQKCLQYLTKFELEGWVVHTGTTYQVPIS